MKKLLLSFFALTFTVSLFSQTTHQVCVSEVSATGNTCVHTAVFTPANLNIAVGDDIEFTTFMAALTGYPGTNHLIRFNGTSPYDVVLPISTNITMPFTSVTTPAFNTPGFYTMECVDGNHCFIADFMTGWSCTGYSVTVGTVTEIEEERLKHEVRVYPNPTTGSFNVNLLPIKAKNPKVVVYDVLGKVVKSYQNLSVDVLSIDLSNQIQGTYFVKVVTDNDSYSFPIAKQ